MSDPSTKWSIEADIWWNYSKTKEFYKCLNRILMRKGRHLALLIILVLYFKPSSGLQTNNSYPISVTTLFFKVSVLCRNFKSLWKPEFFPLWAVPPWELERSELNHRPPDKILILIVTMAKNWWKPSKPSLLC